MITKDLALTEKSVAETPGAVGSWVISSSSYDRVNDRILAPALKSQVGKEVLCLWQHSPDQPIGKWTALRMKGDKLVADLILAKTAIGDMIRELLVIDVPLGASVGFRGKAKGNDKGGMDFSEISLMETSIVSVPCNEDAMRIAKNFGVSIAPDESSSVQAIEGSGKAVDITSTTPNETVTRARQAILRANKELRK